MYKLTANQIDRVLGGISAGDAGPVAPGGSPGVEDHAEAQALYDIGNFFAGFVDGL